MIDAMFQAGTDTALNDQVQRPRRAPTPEPSFSFGDLAKAPFQGIGGAAAKTIAFGAEIVGAFGQVAGAYPEAMGVLDLTEQQQREAEKARGKLLTTGIDYSNEAGDVFRQRVRDILPDPNTTHASAQVVAGLVDFATQAVGYTLTTGPAAPFLLAGDVGLAEADRLKQQGVDESTRTKAGAVAGGLAGVGVVLPMTGTTALSRFVKGAAGGEATMVGQSLAERAILEHAGYDKLAETFDPFDQVALAMGLVPGALGAKFGKPRQQRLTPQQEAQAASDAARLDPARINVLRDEMAKPEATAATKRTLQSEIDAIVQHQTVQRIKADSDLVAAARVQQAADGIEAARLTPDNDLAGRQRHATAMEMASDQIARGEDVRVGVAVEPIPTLEQFMAGNRLAREVELPELKSNFIAWLQSAGGIDIAMKRDISGDANGVRSNPGGIFRRGGLPTDDLAMMAEEAGYLKPGSGGDSGAFVDMVKDAIAGDRVLTLAEQGEQFARDQQNRALADRVSAVERKLRALGVDPTPAQGHVAAMEAYTKLHGPRLLDLALDEVRTARDEARAPPAPSVVDRSSSSPVDKPVETPTAPAAADAEGSGAAAVARAAEDAVALDPDLLVQLDGMDAPMRVADLLEAIKKQAGDDVRDSKLFEVAAACDLRN